MLSFAMCMERIVDGPIFYLDSSIPDPPEEFDPGFSLYFYVYNISHANGFSPLTGGFGQLANTDVPNGWTVADATAEGNPEHDRCRWFRVTCPDEYLGISFGIRVVLTWYYAPSLPTRRNEYAGVWRIPGWDDGALTAEVGTAAHSTFQTILTALDDSVEVTPEMELRTTLPQDLRAWSETDNIIPDWTGPGQLNMVVTYLGDTYEVPGVLDLEQAARGVLGRELAGESPWPGDYADTVTYTNIPTIGSHARGMDSGNSGLSTNLHGLRPAVFRSYSFLWPAQFGFRDAVAGTVTFQLVDKYGRYNTAMSLGIAINALSFTTSNENFQYWTIYGGSHYPSVEQQLEIIELGFGDPTPADNPVHIRYLPTLFTANGAYNWDDGAIIDPDGPEDMPGVIVKLGAALVIISRICRVHACYDDGATWGYIMTLGDYTLLAAAADEKRGVIYVVMIDDSDDPFVAILRPDETGGFVTSVSPMAIYQAIGGSPILSTMRPKRPASMSITGSTIILTAPQIGNGEIAVYISYNETGKWFFN